jgi:hypothetical protein
MKDAGAPAEDGLGGGIGSQTREASTARRERASRATLCDPHFGSAAGLRQLRCPAVVFRPYRVAP